MSRQFVILTLILFAIVGLSAAVAPSTSPNAAPSNDVIGNTDPDTGSGSGDDAEAGPIGSPVPDGVFPESPTEAPAGNGVDVVKVSAVAGVAVVAVATVFF